MLEVCTIATACNRHCQKPIKTSVLEILNLKDSETSFVGLKFYCKERWVYAAKDDYLTELLDLGARRDHRERRQLNGKMPVPKINLSRFTHLSGVAQD